MKTYAKKRMEIIIEAPFLNRLLDHLDQQGVHGYTVVPAIAGKGHGGNWSRDGLVSDAGRLVMVICILDPSDASTLLESTYAQMSNRIGIVSLGDVEVVRDDHF
ncbi:MAG: DUF190 domain-containing protein [Pseudomonadota bacterium]